MAEETKEAVKEEKKPHMSAHRKAYLEQEEANRVFREEQAKRNQKQMDDLAKEIPSPTPDEIQIALGAKSKTVRELEETGKINKPEEKSDDSVAKTSTPADPKGGQYKTRDMNGKK